MTEQPRDHLGRLHYELLRQSGDWYQILAAEPADEEAHQALIRRYADNGDRGAVLRQFQRLDRAMRNELGLEPDEKAQLRHAAVGSGARRRAS